MSDARSQDGYGEVPAPEDLEDAATAPDSYGEAIGDGERAAERATTDDAEGEYGEVPGVGSGWQPSGVDAAGLNEATDGDADVVAADEPGVDLHPETTITKPV